ncbi:uncharacterized protein F4807DRAFT_420892 [Annulohypoxylon truncatum]|uniref:uncharacterized protein n=1 Tax=Annulohypoxylon truncatum TaxID=327061 RepID=UPI002008007F|nr:uncharacterized protein F4807DRAFT_420892 [Annulohypoxylon truncatum]KAI1210933.1 hypothetical protein F4807DRAFT_420892 [Annulohypoxylon truncatum]
MLHLSNLKISLLGFAASLPLAVNAADCFSTEWKFYTSVYDDSWSTRSSLCTNGASGVNCNTDNTFCAVSSGNVVATWEGSDKNGMFGTCMDALNDVINQCVYNNQPGGDYESNGNTWTITVLAV